jgi:flagellar hook-length control protein FliK
VARLNLENLNGLLTWESTLSSLLPPATPAGKSSFDEHLLRAQGTAGQTTAEDSPGRNAGPPSAADASDRPKDSDSAGPDGGTTPDPSASSGANDGSLRDPATVDADHGRRKDDQDDNADPTTAAGAGAAASAKPTSETGPGSKGEASDKAREDPSSHAAGKPKADNVAHREQTSVETRGQAGLDPKAPAAGRGKKEDQDPAKKLPAAGTESATETGPTAASAQQVDAVAPQDAAGGVPAQGIEAQGAQAAAQSPAPVLATIAPNETEAAAQVTAAQPSDTPAADGNVSSSATVTAPSHRAASRAGAKGLAESRAAAAEPGGPSVDGKPDTTQAVSLADSPSAGADATKPPSAAPEREARDGKPAEGPLSARDIATAKPNDQAARSAAERGDPAPGSDQADRVRFVQRVARAFESAADRGGTVRLRLNPPELGSLRLELTVHNGKMSARIEAETQSARNLILDNLPVLRQRLADHQIQVERFDVDLGGLPSGSLPQQSQDQAGRNHFPAGSHVASRGDPAKGAAAVSGQPATVRPGYGNRLDVVI